MRKFSRVLHVAAAAAVAACLVAPVPLVAAAEPGDVASETAAITDATGVATDEQAPDASTPAPVPDAAAPVAEPAASDASPEAALQGAAAPQAEQLAEASVAPAAEDATHAPLTIRAHVSNIGWMNPVAAGSVAGTTGRALALEALEVSLGEELQGAVQLRGHVADVGWQDWRTGVAGTTGQAHDLQAVQIRLTGAAAERYSVYYRAHVAQKGWMGWAQDGEPAGTQGRALAMEAIELVLVPKGEAGPEKTAAAFDAPSTYVAVTPHTTAGWGAASGENAVAGTTAGASIDALKVALKRVAATPGSIEYQTHTAFSSWPQEWTGAGAVSGGAAGVPLEGVRMRLTGELASTHSVWYRVYAAGIGWTGWASDGADAGSSGRLASIRAVDVRLLPKGSAAPGSTAGAYRVAAAPELVVQAHVADIGWMDPVATGMAGTTGRSKALEALRLAAPGINLTIEGRPHVADVGWMGWQDCDDEAIVGTTGQGHALQAVQFRLKGSDASSYTLCYRAHVSNIGWMGWATDGEAAGTTGYGLPIEAIEFKLLPAGATPPASSEPASIEKPTVSIAPHVSNKGWLAPVGSGATAGDPEIIYNLEAFRATLTASVSGGFSSAAYVHGRGWTDEVANGGVTGSTGAGRAIEAVRFSLTGEAAERFDVWYRVYLTDIGWLGWASNGAPAGTTAGDFPAKGIQVKVTPKGDAAPGTTQGAYYDSANPLRYFADYLPGGRPTWVGARHFSRGREGNTWDYIVIHISECPTLSAIDNTFWGTRRASAHFGVGAGQIHQYVSLADTAWAVGNWPWNTRSISIEHVGTTSRPPSRATLDTSAQLMCALAKQKGWTRLVLGQNVGIHKWYVATSCPATLDVTYLVSKANQLLNGRFECPTVPNGPAVPKDRSTIGMLSLSETLSDTSCLAAAGKGI